MTSVGVEGPFSRQLILWLESWCQCQLRAQMALWARGPSSSTWALPWAAWWLGSNREFAENLGSKVTESYYHCVLFVETDSKVLHLPVGVWQVSRRIPTMGDSIDVTIPHSQQGISRLHQAVLTYKVKMKVLVIQLYLTLCDPMGCRPPGKPVTYKPDFKITTSTNHPQRPQLRVLENHWTQRKETRDSKTHSWSRLREGKLAQDIHIFSLHFPTMPEAVLIRNSFEITSNQLKNANTSGSSLSPPNCPVIGIHQGFPPAPSWEVATRGDWRRATVAESPYRQRPGVKEHVKLSRGCREVSFVVHQNKHPGLGIYNWCFRTSGLEKTLESSLDSKIQTSPS